jgi:hypothetical protein
LRYRDLPALVAWFPLLASRGHCVRGLECRAGAGAGMPSRSRIYASFA